MKNLKKYISYGIVLLAFFSTRYTNAACTLYVSPSGDNTNGSSLAHAFTSPQNAEDYIEQSLSTTSSYTFGAAPNTRTYTRYTIKATTTVCIASGTYDALNASTADATTNNYDKSQASSRANYTLYIRVTGTPSAAVSFTAYDRANKPIIIQSGFAGIKVASTANWITLDNLIVKGHAYVANQSAALGRYSDTTKPALWPYYDGNCITVEGNPVDYYKKEDGDFYPIGVPTHVVIQQSKLYACGAAGVGAVSADYLTVADNIVKDNAWWSVFGTSGLSALTSVDSELYPTQTGGVNTSTVKTDISRNYVYGNRNYLAFRYFGPVITDGEGIIIDTNKNGNVTLSDKSDTNPGTVVNVARYMGQTRISDNVVWNNGSSGIQATQSGNITISNNSVYQNRYYPPDAKSETPAGIIIGTPSTIALNPEINLNRMTGPINVWNNILYGPYPLAGHACKSTSGGVTYTCDQIFNTVDTNDSVNESVNIGNNLYYGGGQPVDQPLSDLTGPKNEGQGEIVNSNPQYTTLPVAPPTFGNESSDTLPNLRVGSASPAIRDGYFGQYYPYLGTLDITRAAQPDSNENLIGAYAEHN